MQRCALHACYGLAVRVVAPPERLSFQSAQTSQGNPQNMSRILRQIKPAAMVIVGLCAVATAAVAVPATAKTDTSGSVQAHARTHTGAVAYAPAPYKRV